MSYRRLVACPIFGASWVQLQKSITFESHLHRLYCIKSSWIQQLLETAWPTNP
ncbi:MAG: hypothetical protein ACI84R_002451 [Candidatus Azotimanducaceae bacterium]|jgi:hypothetical protein